MNSTQVADQQLQTGNVFAAQKHLFIIIGIFGIFTNLLMLTVPIFALQVYDHVLSSRSVETLTALMLLASFLFLTMGILDYARKRIAACIGERTASALSARAFHIATSKENRHFDHRISHLQDLGHVRRFFASSVFTALFDSVWVPIFLLGITLFHPWLGFIALIGAVVVTAPLVLDLLMSPGRNRSANEPDRATSALIESSLRNPMLVQVLGMQESIFKRWQNGELPTHQKSIRAAGPTKCPVDNNSDFQDIPAIGNDRNGGISGSSGSADPRRYHRLDRIIGACTGATGYDCSE